MMKFCQVCLIVIVTLVSFQTSFSQAKTVAVNKTELFETITRLDNEMFAAFNACDIDKVGTFFTDDVEFYHEKNGLETSRKLIVEIMKRNLCSPTSNRIRRELVKESMTVTPLNNYGAVQTGEHKFFLTEKGKPEYQDGVGRFVQIWQFKDGAWKISRVISFGFRQP